MLERVFDSSRQQFTIMEGAQAPNQIQFTLSHKRDTERNIGAAHIVSMQILGNRCYRAEDPVNVYLNEVERIQSEGQSIAKSVKIARYKTHSLTVAGTYLYLHFRLTLRNLEFTSITDLDQNRYNCQT
jgi:hypothetical protein